MSSYGYIGQCTAHSYDVQVTELRGPEPTGQYYRIQVMVPKRSGAAAYVLDADDPSMKDVIYVEGEVDAARAEAIAEDFAQRHYGREA